MVSSTEVNASPGAVAAGLPPGSYRLVGFDMDLTGRRLIDEIVHIGGFAPPSDTFSQYVMPHRNLNMESKYRHLLRVITVGRYRMLKSDKTGKILKTKSEISAVTDFVQWLESLKSDSIILLTHETRKTVPLFLLEVLRKYNLYERFTKVVKGFANTYVFAAARCAETVKSYSLYSLCTVLLDKNEHLDSALDRAELTYKIVQHLCATEGDGGDPVPTMTEAVRKMANSIPAEEEDLVGLKELVDRQNSLRPIFGPMIRSRDRFERYRASSLRRLLALGNLTYGDLEAAWKDAQRDSLTRLVAERVKEARTNEDVEDVTELLIGHFQPGYEPVLHKKSRRAAGGKGAADGDKTAEDSGKSSPGKFASAPSSPVKSPPGTADVDAAPVAADSKDADTSR